MSKAWKRLKKNYPAMLSLWVIILAIVLAVIAPVLAPDGTPDANDQVLEITNESPGFSKEMLLVRKNRTVKKGNVITTILRGRENPYSMVPINSYNFSGTDIVVEVYRGERYEAEMDTFSMADVVFPLSVADVSIQKVGNTLKFDQFNGDLVEIAIEDIKARIEKDHLVRKTYRLGTDKFGRDILSRLLFGLRVSMSVGFIAVFISLTIGIAIGSSAGYFRNDRIKVSQAGIIAIIIALGLLILRGTTFPDVRLPLKGFVSFLANLAIIGVVVYASRLALKTLFASLHKRHYFPYDDAAMLIINVVWSIPTILLAMALSFSLGTWIESFWVIYIAVGLSMWVEVARIVRGQVMVVREMEYVQAARGLGFNNVRTILRHILPNIIGPIMVIMAANFAAAILIEAGLSFIGIGVQPPKPSWGIMLSENRNYLKVPGKAFLALAPGISIMILVLAFNLLGNGLRDAFDVKGKES